MTLNKYLQKNISLDYTQKKFSKIDVLDIKKKYLDNHQNFLVIKTGKSIEKDIKFIVKKISYFLGVVLKQNKLGKKFIEIKPNVNLLNKFNLKKKKEKLRYHQTNLGGSIHSDGPQLGSPPNYVIMACSQESNKGGLSIISRADEIYKDLKKNKPSILKTLENNFLFERRGFHSNKIKTFAKPIFKKYKNKLTFRYLREYIEKAYELQNLKLKKKQILSLNLLDKM